MDPVSHTHLNWVSSVIELKAWRFITWCWEFGRKNRVLDFSTTLLSHHYGNGVGQFSSVCPTLKLQRKEFFGVANENKSFIAFEI